MSNELNITPNTKVSLNFSITLETGEVVDTNFDRAPVSFVMGDGSLLCLLYTSPSPRDGLLSRMPSSA